MEIKKIGVLGAGQMGAGIAQIAASKGYLVVLRDIKQEYLDASLAKMKAGLDKRVAAGKETAEAVDATMANISTTVDLSGVKDCDMVIEAVPEILDLKQSTFKELGEICRPDAILCTNTSSMSVTKITKECKNPGRCAGMHFFFPVTAMKLVEIIKGEATTDATVDAVKAVSEGIGKVPVLCKTDTPGFIVNRCLFAFMLEAVRCYEDGVADIRDIDTAIKLGLNHPLGPFEMMDMSGLDTFPHVCETLESLPVTDWSTPASLTKLVAEGRFGKKNGKGWHDYT
ncbi:MAG: 3-hydroxyacyl-CoA dehydrogenase family protein [Lachnospiraceae bacterium]|jgi:3-hydroxybutyryl-CoA dehydrogenase|nr:3-hydroxyacyl-CoA dehydrogenase family protein [Lachnospiraceae bacterium]